MNDIDKKRNTNKFLSFIKKKWLLLVSLISFIIFMSLTLIISFNVDKYFYEATNSNLIVIGLTTLSLVISLVCLVLFLIKRKK